MEEGGRELLASLHRLSYPSDVPSAPLLLTVEDVSDSSVTVSWEPPERLGRLGLQGYELELRREGGERALQTPRGRGLWAQQGQAPRPRHWPVRKRRRRAHMTSGGPYPPAPGSP